MIRLFVLPVIAVVGIALAGWTAARARIPPPVAQAVAEPATPGFAHFVAGAGLVEPSSEAIAIGAPVGGLVVEVPVKPGTAVKAGDLLLRLDDRVAKAQIAAQEAAVAVAKAQAAAGDAASAAAAAQVARLEAMPRAEDLPPLVARLTEAKAAAADAADQLALIESVSDPRAVSREDISRRRRAVDVGNARVQAAEAELARMRAGAWKAELDVVRAQLLQAQAQALAARAQQAQAEAALAAARVEHERLSVRAPIDGEVLQVRVRAGEFAPTGQLQTPLMLLGAVAVLHVRVDIDEHESWRVRDGAPAECVVRGNAQQRTRMRWVRTEPFVVPKRSLTGDSAERVDTRVMQVIYAFDRTQLPLPVGQQVDVYIEAQR